MNSLTAISASDLIWQMDTCYTIFFDRCARRSAGCCHFEFRNKTSLFKFLPSCTWSSWSAWICMLSSGRILIEFTGMQTVLRCVDYIFNISSSSCDAEAKQMLEFDMQINFPFVQAVWPFSTLTVIRQAHNCGQRWFIIITALPNDPPPKHCTYCTHPHTCIFLFISS